MTFLRRRPRSGPARCIQKWITAPLRIPSRILRRSTQLRREGGIRLAPLALRITVNMHTTIVLILAVRAPSLDVAHHIAAVVSVATISTTERLATGGSRVGPIPAL